MMGIIAGVVVCAIVYVMREAHTHPGEEDWRSY